MTFIPYNPISDNKEMDYVDENGDTIQCDMYTYNEKYGKIRIIDVRNLLNISDQRFLDLLNEPYRSKDGSLNKRHLITHFEEMFRSHGCDDSSPFFNRKNIFSRRCNFDITTLDLYDLEMWLNDNYNLLIENNICNKKGYGSSCDKEDDKLDEHDGPHIDDKVESLEGLPTNIKTVIRMLREGKTYEEIAKDLYRAGAGMSQAQVAALLWRGIEFPAQSTLKNSASDLLKSSEGKDSRNKKVR